MATSAVAPRPRRLANSVAAEPLAALRRRQLRNWSLVGLALLLLLSRFSAGFFVYAAAIVALLWLLATAWVVAVAAGLVVERRLTAEEVEIGEVVEVTLAVHNRGIMPVPWFFWRDEVAAGLDAEGPTLACRSVRGHGEAELTYRLHCLRRGFFRVGPAVAEVADPFGLVRRFVVEPGAPCVTVLPRVVDLGESIALGQRPVHEIPHRRSLFEDPSRFLGLRDYRPGDSLRRIHWRATARQGRLQTRVFEPSVLAGLLLAVEMARAAYPPQDESSEPLIELAITTAASVGEYVLAGDQAVGLLANGVDAADRFPGAAPGGSFRRLAEVDAVSARGGPAGAPLVELPPGKGDWQRARLATALARLEPAAGVSLAQLLMLELPRLPRSLVVFVVTPHLGPELAGALAALRRSGIETGVAWIGAADLDPAVGLPPAVPLYPVASEDDLRQIGGRRL